MIDEADGKHGVQSLEIGMGILRAMVDGQRAMMLKEIAAAAEMPPSKAHRYLVSLIRAGLVEQDPMTSRYDLGPFAMNIGLVALDRLDRVRLGLNAIATPIFDSNDACVATLAVVGSIQFLPERPKQADIDALTKASQQISRKLGHASPQDTLPRRRKATAA